MSETAPYSTVPLPDGIVIGGPWPQTIISWPGGKGRDATKPEHDLFQALERANAENSSLRASIHAARGLLEPLGNQVIPSVQAIREALQILRRL